MHTLGKEVRLLATKTSQYERLQLPFALLAGVFAETEPLEYRARVGTSCWK